MSAQQFDPNSLAISLRELKIKLLSQQDISPESMVALEQNNIIGLLKESIKLIEQLNKEVEISSKQVATAEEVEEAVIGSLEEKLKLNNVRKQEQIDKAGLEKKETKIKAIDEHIKSLGGEDKEIADENRTVLDVAQLRLKQAKADYNKHQLAINKICTQWNEIIPLFSSKHDSIKKINLESNDSMLVQLQALENNIEQIATVVPKVQNKAIEELITSFQDYLTLRAEALKYQGKDFIKTGKNLSDSKDARFNSIERVIACFALLKTGGKAEDYLKALQLVGRELSKIKTETSNYRELLQKAKNVLVEALTEDAKKDSHIKSQLEDILTDQLKTQLHNDLLGYRSKRQRSLLRMLPDIIYPDTLMQRIYVSSAIAREIANCETTLDYFRLIKNISEKITEINDLKSELSQKLQAAKRQILENIVLPGRTKDKLSKYEYKMFELAGYLSDVAPEKSNPVYKTEERQGPVVNSTYIGVSIADKEAFFKDITTHLKKINDEKVKNSLEKLVVNFYACKTADDYLLHYELVDKEVEKIQPDLNQYIPSLLSYLEKHKKPDIGKSAAKDDKLAKQPGITVTPLAVEDKAEKNEQPDSTNNHTVLPSELVSFRDELKKTLDVKFLAHKLLSSDLFARKKSSVANGFNIAENVVAAAAVLCGLPSAPFVAIVHGIGIVAQRQEESAKAADDKKFANFKIDAAMEKMVEEKAEALFRELYSLVAQKVIEKYPHQILQLKHKNGDDEAFNKVISSLTNNIIKNYDGSAVVLTQADKDACQNKDNPKELKQVWLDKFAEKLVQGVENHSWLSGSLVKHADDKMTSLFGQHWNTNSMFARAGLVVKTDNGCIFYTGHGVEPEKYGYRFATLEEVDRLNFKPDEKANKRSELGEMYNHLANQSWDSYKKSLEKIKQPEPRRTQIIEKQQQAKTLLEKNLDTIELGIQRIKRKIDYLTALMKKLDVAARDGKIFGNSEKSLSVESKITASSKK